MMRHACLLILALLICPPVGRAREPAAEKRPAILMCTFRVPGRRLDFDYLKRLHGAGFTVDYLDSWEDFSWERISQYNVLMMFGFPFEYRGTTHQPAGASGLPVDGPGFATTHDLFKRFLAAGGGVLFNIRRVGGNPAVWNTTRQVLVSYGADLPMELISVPPAYQAPHPRLRGMLFLYTENIAETPVSEGVNGIWWPNPPYGKLHYNRWSAPIHVDDSWQVAVRAPAGSRTYPFVPRHLDEFAEEMRITDALIRPEGVEEPPLFAVRDDVEGAGRLAIFHCLSVFHVGSGTSWIHNGAMLDKGLGRHRSDFGRLLENTFHYLAAPSVASGKLGGADVPESRVEWPTLQKAAAAFHDPAKAAAPVADMNPDSEPATVNVYRGLIGARTVLSGGTGTVADYAQAARESGLDFLVFLEDFAELTPAELEQLTAECQANSSDDLLLLPGYHLVANTGNRMFFYGAEPVYPHDKVMSSRAPHTYMLQGENPDGSFTSKRVPGLTFQIKNFMGKKRAGVNNIGFFDFHRTGKDGAMQMYHCKGFGAAALVFYEHGERVEDVTDQYLRTNAGCMTCVPVTVDLVDSPAALTAAVAAGHTLTHAVAPSVPEVVGALNKNHQFESPTVHVSAGPVIRLWPRMYRPFVFGEENFANGTGLIAADLHVQSAVGLREVALYQGERLFRRFVPSDPQNFHVRLFLTALMQNNISAVAVDRNGKRAVSFPLHSRKAGDQQQISYCGDHVNEGYATRMARGPNQWAVMRYPEISAAGRTWDGGPKAYYPMAGFHRFGPTMTAADGSEQGNMNQYPELLFADEGVYCGKSVLSGTIPVGGNPWRGWGPLAEPTLYEGYSVVTEFGQYTDGVDPTAWGGPGLRHGSLAFLYEQELTMLRDMTVTELKLSIDHPVPDVDAMLLAGRGTALMHAFDLPPARDSKVRRSLRLTAGDWFAGVTDDMANCFLAFNRGADLQLDLDAYRFNLNAAFPADGLPVRKGDTHRLELLTFTWPLNIRVVDSEDLLALIDHLTDPDGLELLNGSRRDAASSGLLELDSADGTVALRLRTPRAFGLRELPETSLPVRVHGLEPRWSAGLQQVVGFNGKGYYSDGRQVFRPLGVDPEGRCAFPIHQFQANMTQLAAGHPVIAEGDKAEQLFIQVTALTNYGPDGKGLPRWHLSVNNPLDTPVSATVRRTMKLPGFTFDTETVTLAPGEYRILFHNAE